MIAYVRGQVTVVRPTEAVIDVGGVGLALHCTPSTTSALRLGEVHQLAASLVVREESLTLYGFADEDEKAVFELLQTASGVGPRLAQAMLSVHSPDDLRRAVATEDLVALTKVPGIGKKGAQRIVIELKDKLGVPGSGPSLTAVPSGPAPGSADWQVQVHEALLGLGWSTREADRAVDDVAADLNGSGDGDHDVSVLLRKALRHLART